MSECRNVLLDLDGTIVDPRQGFVNSVSWALRNVGVEPPSTEQILRYIGPPLEVTFTELLAERSAELLEPALQHYFERYGEIGAEEASLYPSMLEAIVSLGRFGRHLWICTSKPRPFAQAVIQLLGLSEYFEGIYGSEFDGTHVDKSDLLAHLLQREQLRPEETVFVGDRLFDAIAGCRNGVRVIGVTWGYGSADELLAAGAECLVHSPEELLKEICGPDAAFVDATGVIRLSGFGSS